MSKVSENSENNSESLPLHELLSSLLKSEKTSHRHPLPIMGTMQDLNQTLERRPLLDFINASLRGPFNAAGIHGADGLGANC